MTRIALSYVRAGTPSADPSGTSGVAGKPIESPQRSSASNTQYYMLNDERTIEKRSYQVGGITAGDTNDDSRYAEWQHVNGAIVPTRVAIGIPSELFNAYNITLDADRASSAATNHALQLGATDLEYEVTRVKSPVIGRDMNPMGRGDGTYYANGGNLPSHSSLAIRHAKPSFVGERACGYGSSVNNGEDSPEGPDLGCFTMCICAPDCLLEWFNSGQGGYPDSCCNSADIQMSLDCCLGSLQEDPEKRSWFITDCLGCKGESDLEKPDEPEEPEEKCCLPTGVRTVDKTVRCYIWKGWEDIGPPGIRPPVKPLSLMPSGVLEDITDRQVWSPGSIRVMRRNYPIKIWCELTVIWTQTTWTMINCEHGGIKKGKEFGFWRKRFEVHCPSDPWSGFGYKTPPEGGRMTCTDPPSKPEDAIKHHEGGFHCPERPGSMEGVWGGRIRLRPQP